MTIKGGLLLIQRIGSICQAAKKLEKYQSVFDIIQMPKSAFIKDFNGKEAADIYDLALGYATEVARRFRASRLFSTEVKDVEGPTYQGLFKENWAAFCRTRALEANDSPIAYLVDIYKFALRLESTVGADAIDKLKTRRPELAQLKLDEVSLNQTVSLLTIVNRILAEAGQNFLTAKGEKKSFYQVLAQTRYPFQLPYDAAHKRIQLGLADKGLSLMMLIQQADIAYPYFTQVGTLSSACASVALQQGSGLSSGMQNLMTEAPFFNTYTLNLADIQGKRWEGASTSETSLWVDPSSHAYFIPIPSQQGKEDPTTLVSIDNAYDQKKDIVHYDIVNVRCKNAKNSIINVKLRAQNCEFVGLKVQPPIYARKLSNCTRTIGYPFPREPAFSYYADDNPGLSLSDGPYTGVFTIQAKHSSFHEPFLEMRFSLILDEKASKVSPLTDAQQNFLSDNYGVNIDPSSPVPLSLLTAQTGLTIAELEQLLCTQGMGPSCTSVVASPHVEVLNTIFIKGNTLETFPAPYHYGAVFLHANQLPRVYIKEEEKNKANKSIIGLSYDRLDRVNRLIRLQGALKLSYDKLDLLVISAMRSEGVENLGLHMNANTVRMLGVFDYLKVQHGVTPEVFAAFLHEITPFAVGTEIPFFDRVFNTPPLFDQPFKLDWQEFDYTQAQGDDAKTVKQLCAGLDIDEALFRQLAPIVFKAQSFGEKKLRRSLSVVSAFYRLVKLPRLFGLTVLDGIELLKILADSKDKEQYLNQLAGVPVISKLDDKNQPKTTDVLDVIMALATVTQWLNTHHLSAQSLISLLNPPPKTLSGNAAQVALINEITQHLEPARLTNERIAHTSGVTLHGKDGKFIDWLNVLSKVLDNNGLVKSTDEINKAAQEVLEAKKIEPSSDKDNLVKLIDEAVREASKAAKIELPSDHLLVLEQSLVKLIVRAKAAQDNVTVSVLAKSLQIAHQLPLLLLSWIDSSSYAFLSQTYALSSKQQPLQPSSVDQTYLTLLYKLVQHAVVVNQFKLSGAMMQTFLASPNWFGVPNKELSLTILYQFSRYADWLKLTSDTEDHVLQYLAQANHQADVEPQLQKAEKLAQDAAQKLADLLGWKDSEEVKQAVAHICGENRIAKNLTHIDGVMRLYALTRQTGLSVAALLKAAALTPTSPYSDYQQVGESLMTTIQSDASVNGELITAQLNQSSRDALVAYYLGQIIPKSKNPILKNVKSADDLYEYLLIDNQVSDKVVTSQVAQAIASVQQYINSLFLQIGQKSATPPDPAELVAWTQHNSQYAIWAANQQLQDYPENYLNPTLRLTKTASFEKLESALNQNRINEDTVQAAVLDYLNNFEEVSNLQFVSGYIDGGNFKESVYYFVGQNNATPIQYFWRSMDIRKRDVQDEINPVAWSEWEKIDIPVSDEVVAIRPVVIKSRLYIVWVERSQTPVYDKNNKPTSNRKISVKLAYKKYNDTWSAPKLLFTQEKSYLPHLIALVDQRNPDQPYLLVMIFKDNESDLDLHAYNVLLSKIELETDISKALFLLFLRPGKLQHPYYRENKLPSVTLSHLPGPVNTQTLAKRYIKSVKLFTEDIFGGGGTIKYQITNKITEDSTTKLNFSMKVSFPKSVDVRYFIGAYFRCALYYREIQDNDYSVYKEGDITEIFHFEGPKWKFEEDKDTFNYFYSTVIEIKTDDLIKGIKLFRPVTYGLTDDKHNKWAYQIVGETFKPEIELNEPYNHLQYLDISEIGLQNKPILLNTVFGKELIARASVSIEALLSLETQQFSELPGETESQANPIDFHGANSLYFWELFFHLPFLIAYRLNAEQQHQDAQHWLHYIFNPFTKTNKGTPTYWHMRALMEDGHAAALLDGPTDPDAVAYADPLHYRKAVFLAYVKNIIDHGDQLYRQLTQDSLNEAKLRYYQALNLLGPRPIAQLVSRWAPIQLDNTQAKDTSALRTFEENLQENELKQMVLSPGAPNPTLRALDTDLFHLPLNTQLFGYWDTLESRMYNLRHNLTLDGKPLSLPLYDAPINPRELLAQRGRNGTLNGNESSHELDIPPYRFRAILPRAYTAVEMLCYFGNMLLSALERKEHAAQEELQQAQLLDLSSYTLTLQQQAVDMARASQAALQVGKAAAQQRYDHYKQLYDENISNSEQIVGGLRGAAQIALAATQPLQIASGAASLVPNIFGLSDGGSKWGAPLFALAIEGQIWSDGLTFSADIIAESEQYRRRREEWEIQYKQAQSEMNVIDKQMETQALQIQAAQTTLQQTKAQQAQVQAMHVFLKTRFTQASLYQWLVSQLSVLYYQAYDAVLSLCLGTQACWRYERGDFETNFIQTSAWNDSYRGLLVGETLKLNLQQMEAAYLNRDERRLEITHTVSLKQMFGEAKWESNLTTLRSDGSLEFELKERHFSERYPGHYLRQIVAVTVTLPASVGPYQDIRATLTQNSSKFTTRADLNAVESLLDETKSSFTDIKNVKTNLRASQQVALSSGLDDSGLFVLNFGDERYLPFEGTGVVSSWQLTFPRPDAPDQKKMLETLTDVIVRIRYTACDGGEEFAKQVERELTKAVKR